MWPFATKAQVNRLENQMSKLQVQIENLYSPERIIEAASKCFEAGVEASKVESLQASAPVFFNAEAREGIRKTAEANGLTQVNEALRDPNNATFINDPDCARDE